MNEIKTSLFEDHLTIIEGKDLNERQIIEKLRMDEISLPPLVFPEVNDSVSHRPSIKDKILDVFSIPQFQVGMAVAFVALFVGSFVLKQMELEIRRGQDQWIAKGTARVSYYIERDGHIQTLKNNEELQNGDKIGAKVISSSDAVAYWGIVNHKNELLITTNELFASKIELKAGVSGQFNSSFTLLPPNEGENLIVIICEYSSEANDIEVNVLNENFISKTLANQSIKAENCMYVGRRLRSLGAQ